jgi:hypothetical protein
MPAILQVAAAAPRRFPPIPTWPPIIARDVHERLIDSFRRFLASPPVPPPRPARPGVERSESGAKSRIESCQGCTNRSAADQEQQQPFRDRHQAPGLFFACSSRGQLRLSQEL